MKADDHKRQDIEFHRQTAEEYDETIAKPYHMYHAYSLYPFLDHVRNLLTEQQILDLGCGTGVVTLALAARGFKVCGLDHSPEMINIARHKARRQNLLSSIEFAIGDVESLAFDDEEFDGVTCQGLLHHLQDITSCLSELSRVLKHNGFFYISEPTADYTIASRIMRSGWTLLPISKRSTKTPDSRGKIADSVEASISSTRLFTVLDRLGLIYRVQYLSHIPFLDKRIPDSVRLSITKLLSSPWTKTAGDIVFVYGKKP